MATETVEITPTLVKKTVRRCPDELKPYWFKPGHPPSGGRPKGSKNRLNAQDILKMRETRIAKRYVQRAEQSDTVLIDAMKHLLPKDAASDAATRVVIFVGDGAMPRQIEEGYTAMPRQIDSSDAATPVIEAPRLA